MANGKKDLARVGIKYVTKAGVADFHAAGRHTFITQLLRHGVSLPEAKSVPFSSHGSPLRGWALGHGRVQVPERSDS
jgi:hypothetical protein